MGSFDPGASLTHEELAWELVEVFDELSVENINELLIKNVPLETLEFIAEYANEFGEANDIAEAGRKRLPNLLLLGYLLRVVEERLLGDDGSEDA